MQNATTGRPSREATDGERFRQIFEQSTLGMATCDKTMRFINANTAFCAMLGYSESELAHLTFKEITHPGAIGKDSESIQKLWRGEIGSYSTEKRYITKNGAVLDGAATITAIHDARGKHVESLVVLQDISERKRAEQKLAESERLYRRLVETTETGYVIIDSHGTVLDANHEYVRLCGRTKLDEVIGRSVLEWTADKDKKANAQAIASCAKHGWVRGLEVTYVDANGKTTPVEINATSIEIQGGQNILSLCRDITERRRAELALRESEENFRVLFEENPLPTLLSEVPSGKIAFVNKTLTRLLGTDAAGAIGKTAKQLGVLKHPADQENLTRLIMEQGFVDNVEVESVSEAGEESVSLVSMRLLTAHGKPYCLSVLQDITGRKRAEEAVLAEKERLAVTLRSIGDAVIATDVSGAVAMMNGVAEALTGWRLEEAEGRPLSDVFNIVNELTRDKLVSPADKVLASGGIVELASHTVLISRHGKERIITDSGAPIKDKNGKIVGVVLVFRDVTEKQKFMETIQRTAKLDSLGVLAGGIAHDFNNLLTGIYAYIDLARIRSKDAQTTEYLQSTLATLNRAKALTLQLLTFAKGGAPVQRITPLKPFVQETAQFALSGSNVSCRFSLPQTLWHCNIDKNQIGQVIDNIVINAQQAMPNGGEIIISAVNVSFEEKQYPLLRRGDYVKVSIKDCGIGIPKDIMPRIFDPFYTTKIKGHGLGLATCYSIVNRHGGAIEVESEPGAGSTFHVFLPASRKPAAASEAPAADHRGCGVMLVVDDEEIVRNALAKMLGMLGYDVVCKNDGREALEFIRDQTMQGGSLCAVLFDLTIPGGMGGKDAVAEVRKLSKDIPIFVMSGYADDAIMRDPAQFGFTASIAKPFTISDLSEMLAAHMTR